MCRPSGEKAGSHWDPSAKVTNGTGLAGRLIASVAVDCREECQAAKGINATSAKMPAATTRRLPSKREADEATPACPGSLAGQGCVAFSDGSLDTEAMKRYPCRGIVSIYLDILAEWPSAYRTGLTALF